MPESNGTAEKGINKTVQRKTVQKAPPTDLPFSAIQEPAMFFLATVSDDMEPWGRNYKLRDRMLREFIPQEPLFLSALGIVCARNAAFGWKLEGPEAPTKRMQDVLANADFGAGWTSMITKVSIDLYTQDNGAFIEVIRDGASENSPVVGLAHLDSARCWHTGHPETPVLYVDREGQYHFMKWYQVCVIPEMPTAIEGLYGLQYCALTRLFRAARILRDLSIYFSEKIGGRHTRSLLGVSGVTSEDVDAAMTRSQIKWDQQGMQRFTMPVVLSSKDPLAEVKFNSYDVTSIPDGFDVQELNKEYINQLAMAFLTDYQEFAPLPGGNLGSSSQSEILHMKTQGKGPGLFMKVISQALNFSVLPKNVEFKFDEQDMAADKAEAENSKLRSESRKLRIESQEITPQVARQIAYELGDLTDEQMELLEKQDKEAAAKEEEQARIAQEQATAQLEMQREQLAQVTPAQNPPLEETLDDDSTAASQQEVGNTVDGDSSAESQEAGDEDEEDDEKVEQNEKALNDRAGPSDARLRVEEEVGGHINAAFDELWEEFLDNTDQEEPVVKKSFMARVLERIGG